MELFYWLANKLAMIAALFTAVVFHEYSHGFIADKLGDPTARYQGRLSLNPIVHIDPVGTIILPIAILILSGGAWTFGWAKPVPVNAYNFSDPEKGMAKVGLSGPLSNFILATTAALLLRLAGILPSNLLNLIMAGYGALINPFIAFLGYVIFINLLLGIFNLMPVPPLDGSHILMAYLPREMAWQYRKIAPYGMFIVLFIAMFLFDIVIFPFLRLVINLYSIH